MKKIFKALSVMAVAATMCAGVAAASGCSAGYNGTYNGQYHYVNSYGQTYGMVVEVTVKNNIITEIKDVTNTNNEYAVSVQKDADGKAATWTTVSPGWVDYYTMMWGFGQPQGNVEPQYDENNQLTNSDDIEAIMPSWYSWANADSAKWPTYENWLLQQYVGWSAADILDISVFYSSYGEPYATKDGYNAQLETSGLLITNSTQGSGRLLLAVQDALTK